MTGGGTFAPGTDHPGGVLFHARNRRGLGHVMRAYNIASAVQARDPHCPIQIHATRPPDPQLFDSVPVMANLDVTAESTISWSNVIETRWPAVIVHDTTLKVMQPDIFDTPDTSDAPGRRTRPNSAPPPARVLVMRRRSPGQHQELLADPLLPTVTKFIVPHTPDEFGFDLPESVRERSHFVGPIARRPSPTRVSEVRQRMLRGADNRLVTVTVGGGGFDEQADRFFEIVAACIPFATASLPFLRFRIVLGPNYAHPTMPDRLASLPNTSVVRVEPRLVDLIAASDLVIAEGGYNTVTEVRLAQVPAVFLPSRRKLDDQRERVARIEATGAARVLFPESSIHDTTRELCALLGDGSTLASMRSAAQVNPIELGNESAAEVILSLRRQPVRGL